MNDETSISRKYQEDEKEQFKEPKVEHELARQMEIKGGVDTTSVEKEDTIIE